MKKLMKHEFVNYLFSIVLYFSGVLAWSFFSGYSTAYVLLTLFYLVFILLIPGFFISLLLLRKNHDIITLLAYTAIIGFFVMLLDYFMSVLILSPRLSGTFILLIYIFILISFLIPKIKNRIFNNYKTVKKNIPRINLITAIILSILGIAVYIWFTLLRPTPGIGNYGYGSDTYWHIGTVVSLTKSFPPVTMRIAYPLTYRYHFLVHILAAHIANTLKLHPSLVFLNYIYSIIAFFLIYSIFLILNKLKIKNYLIPIGILICIFGSAYSVDWKSINIFVSESFVMGIILFILTIILLIPDALISNQKITNLLVLSVGLGLTTAAKGSAGIILLCSIGLYNLVFIIKDKIKINFSLIIKSFFILSIWGIFYTIFFYGLKSTIELGLFNEFDKLTSYSGIMNHLEKVKLKISGSVVSIKKILFMIAYYIFYYIIKLFSIFKFLIDTLSWRLVGLLSIFFIKKEKKITSFLITIVIVSFIFLISLDKVHGHGIVYFWFMGIIACDILFIMFNNYFINKYNKRTTTIIIPILLVFLCLSLYVGSRNSGVFKAKFFDNYNSTRSLEVENTLNHNLYDILAYIRDKLPDDTIIIHNYKLETESSILISAFSERQALLENLAYMFRGSEGYLDKIADVALSTDLDKAKKMFKNKDPVVLDIINNVEYKLFLYDPHYYNFLKEYKRIKNIISIIFSDQINSVLLKQMGNKNYIILDKKDRIEHINNKFSNLTKILYKNKKYGIIYIGNK